MKSKGYKRGWHKETKKDFLKKRGIAKGMCGNRANRDEKSIAWVLQEQRSDPLCYSISHPGSGIRRSPRVDDDVDVNVCVDHGEEDSVEREHSQERFRCCARQRDCLKSREAQQRRRPAIEELTSLGKGKRPKSKETRTEIWSILEHLHFQIERLSGSLYWKWSKSISSWRRSALASETSQGLVM